MHRPPAESWLAGAPGEVDKILQTVVNNIMITNNLEIVPDVRCRVLLTSPLESFTIGHTIVISRGLLDVLPDEASLAMALAHEFSHIALGTASTPALLSTTGSSFLMRILSSVSTSAAIPQKKKPRTTKPGVAGELSL